MSKMTAVEWLCSQIYTIKVELEAGNDHLKMKIEKAKEMENQQRQKDFKAGNECACMEHENIEDYFNQYIKSK